MEVDFPPEIQTRINRAADAFGSDSAEYVLQLVQNYLDHDVWFRQKVNDALQQLDRGQFVTHEEMRMRIDELLHP